MEGTEWMVSFLTGAAERDLVGGVVNADEYLLQRGEVALPRFGEGQAAVEPVEELHAEVVLEATQSSTGLDVFEVVHATLC